MSDLKNITKWLQRNWINMKVKSAYYLWNCNNRREKKKERKNWNARAKCSETFQIFLLEFHIFLSFLLVRDSKAIIQYVESRSTRLTETESLVQLRNSWFGGIKVLYTYMYNIRRVSGWMRTRTWEFICGDRSIL